MSRTMYHYASENGYEGILASREIRPSLKANNPKDARFGEGLYLSDIVPGMKRPSQLSMIFFGIPFAGKRFSHHIDIDTGGLKVMYGRKHVYVVHNDKSLDISKRLSGHGKV